jgi:hypothetical protein
MRRSIVRTRSKGATTDMNANKTILLWGAMIALTAGGMAQDSAKPAAGNEGTSTQITLTPMWAELQQPLDVKSAKSGDPVTAKMIADAKLNDGSEVAKGSMLLGQVSKAEASQNKSDAALTLVFDKIQLMSGKTIPVRTTLVALRDPKGTPGPDSILMASGLAVQGAVPSKSENMAGAQDALPHASSFPQMTLSSSLDTPHIGVVSRKGKNFKLDKGTQVEIAAAVIPKGVDVINK